MATKSGRPGDGDGAPIESRRTPDVADAGALSNDEVASEDGEGSVLDLPDLGTFSAESARPTPLDDIAEIERGKAPRD